MSLHVMFQLEMGREGDKMQNKLHLFVKHGNHVQDKHSPLVVQLPMSMSGFTQSSSSTDAP